MSPGPSRRRWTSALGGSRRIGAVDVLLTLLVAALAAASSMGWTGSNAGNPAAGPLAAALVLTMVVPAAFARRSPVPVALAIAVGAALNWALAGHLVRCGVGLPVVFYVAFLIGACRPGWRAGVIGSLGTLANLTCQAYADPVLGANVLIYMVPVTLGFTGAGVLVGLRRETVATLRRRTDQLREQRDENARLAVAADRARIASDFGGFVQSSVEQIEHATLVGRDRLAVSPSDAERSFVEIQLAGRAALAQMREVVANLSEDAPTAPEPMLAQVDRLVARATEGRGRARVSGDPRLLPAGLELSGYRIIERLVQVVDHEGAVDVTVGFEAHELRISVAGPSGQPTYVQAALAAVKERVAMHGGVLETSAERGHRTTVVRLPLALAHV
jgi:hypothetical protein